MKRVLGLKAVANLTIFVMLIGGIVFTLGFGTCMYIARHEVTKEVNHKIKDDVKYINSYIDGQLQRVEDAAYSIASCKFGNTVRTESGEAFVAIDPESFAIPSEEECFLLLEQFMDANPQICGAAIGFEPNVYPDTKGQYGFAAYVTRVSGKTQRLRLGEMHDYHKKEWYSIAASSDQPYWSKAFRETSNGKVVTCFSLPLHGYGNKLVGVLALDIDTEAFCQKCRNISPFPNSEVTIVDRDFRFIFHPDSSYILQHVRDVGEYASYKADDSMKIKILNHEEGNYAVNEGTDKEAFFHFMPIERSGWTVTIECPKDGVYGGIERMKRDTTIIAIISILIMIVCFVYIFRKLESVTLSKASMDSELDVAARIQMGMLRKDYPAFPERKDIDIYGMLRPAKAVGGDLYDYIIRDEKLYFCIGDVSGKGIPASMFMVVISNLFRNISSLASTSDEIMTLLNNHISEGNDQNMFCTLFVGILDLNTGRLDYCNAGHNAPIIRRVDDGKTTIQFMTPKTNIAAGVFGGFPFEAEETELHPGDTLFMYTDGITEAEDTDKRLFGEGATLNALLEARLGNIHKTVDLAEYVFEKVKEHSRGTIQSDDITMLVIEYTGHTPMNSHLTLHNDIAQITPLAEWVEETGETIGIAPDKIFNINLALEEVIANIISYAYPDQTGQPIHIDMDYSDGVITYTITDHGLPFDPTRHANPDTTLSAEQRPIGGLGIMLARRLSTSMTYRRSEDKNILTITF